MLFQCIAVYFDCKSEETNWYCAGIVAQTWATLVTHKNELHGIIFVALFSSQTPGNNNSSSDEFVWLDLAVYAVSIYCLYILITKVKRKFCWE